MTTVSEILLKTEFFNTLTDQTKEKTKTRLIKKLKKLTNKENANSSVNDNSNPASSEFYFKSLHVDQSNIEKIIIS